MPERQAKVLEQRVRLDEIEAAYLERLRQKWGMRYPADALRHCIRRCMNKEREEKAT